MPALDVTGVPSEGLGVGVVVGLGVTLALFDGVADGVGVGDEAVGELALGLKSASVVGVEESVLAWVPQPASKPIASTKGSNRM